MPCYKPLQAFRAADGSVVWNDRVDTIAKLDLPCGQCVGCRLERSRQWAVRCMHEAAMHSNNVFITLTYSPEHMPRDGSLNYKDFQLFMKRLRKKFGKVRFYMCGEYGENLQRPHYHAVLFGFDLPDKKVWKRTGAGSIIYNSAILNDLWGFGFTSVGDVTFESAAYVARYCMKKVTGQLADDYYTRMDTGTGEFYQVTPEFNRMSLKPGIGRPWFDKWQADVYPHDRVISNGVAAKPPKYYDKVLKSQDPDAFEDLQYQRFLEFSKFEGDNTAERRAVKEAVTKARISKFNRSSI